MDREPNRTRGPHAGADRHNINVTRLCLRTGSVQLPFALAGRLPEGELLAHELESDEAMVLWSEPPRHLAGLGPLFEAHEVQVNDAVILEVRGDEVRVGLHKRPRRARPKVTPSTWASHRMPDVDARRQVTDQGRPTDGPSAEDDSRAGESAAPHADGDEGTGATRYESAGTYETDLPRGVAEPDISPGDAPPEAPRVSRGADPFTAGRHDADVPDDAPRAPRVKVKPLSEDAPSGRTPPGTAQPSHTPEGAGGAGLFGGMVRTVRGWFGGPDEREQGPEAADATPRRAPDWTQAWDEPDESEDPLRTEGAGDPLSQVEQRVSFRSEATPDTGRTDRERPGPSPEGREASEVPTDPATPPDRVARLPREADASPPDPGGHEAASSDDEDLAAKRAARWQDDGGAVPSRAERFLAGDLRTRLLRFLSSPDMPLIAKTEMIASRFDLDLDTARDLLQDIADDPPDELRLTPIRENAWRVERTGY